MDRFVQNGVPHVYAIPEPPHGKGECRAVLDQLQSPNPAEQFAAALRLAGQGGPDARGAVLDALRSGSPAAPVLAQQFIGDEDVTVLLLQVAPRAHLRDIPNYCQALEAVCGRRAIPIVRDWVTRLGDATVSTGGSTGVDERSTALCSAAGCLLRLDDGDEVALRALCTLIGHPNRLNRSGAAREIATTLKHRVRLVVGERLMAVARAALLAPEPATFGSLAHVCFELDPEMVLDGCTRLLKGPEEQRQAALIVLGSLTNAEATEILHVHVECEPSLRHAIHAMRFLRGRFLDEPCARRLECALMDESPSLRWIAMDVLSDVEREVRQRMAREALRDEPDEFLSSTLESLAGTGGPAGR